MKFSKLCLAPWVHGLVHTDKKLRPCCQYPESSDYEFTQHKEWWNSDSMRSLRSDLYNGVEHKGCANCWNTESLGKESLRQGYNKLFKKVVDFKKLIKSKDDNFILTDPPVTWDLRLGNLCNLKCVMCSPAFSDKIEEEYEINKDKVIKLNLLSSNNDTVHNWTELSAGKEFLIDLQSNSEWIKFQGGEPLSIKSIRDFLENLNKNCVVDICTNGTIADDNFLNILKKFKKVTASISLESVSIENNIIRYGSDIEKILNNIEKFKLLPNLEIQLNHVMQVTSISNLVDIIKYAEQNNFHLSLIPLGQPSFLSLNSCSKKFLDKLVNEVDSLVIQHPKNQYIKSFLKKLAEQHQFNLQQNKNLLEYTEYLDSIRPLKFKPLIISFIEEQYESRKS
jgi:organic radical activating enzyme